MSYQRLRRPRGRENRLQVAAGGRRVAGRLGLGTQAGRPAEMGSKRALLEGTRGRTDGGAHAAAQAGAVL